MVLAAQSSHCHRTRSHYQVYLLSAVTSGIGIAIYYEDMPKIRCTDKTGSQTRFLHRV